MLLRCYLASPLGFSQAGREFMQNTMVPFLEGLGLDVVNPWGSQAEIDKRILEINKTGDFERRAAEFSALNKEIAHGNQKMIDGCGMMVAVLDGQDVDSGTAAEIGYAYAKGIRVYGYRGDFRLASENIGCKVNLQVDYFCHDIASDMESLGCILGKR